MTVVGLQGISRDGERACTERMAPAILANVAGDRRAVCGASPAKLVCELSGARLGSGPPMSSAIIRTGGQQYRVSAGDVLRLANIAGDAGQDVVFDEVLALLGDGSSSE